MSDAFLLPGALWTGAGVFNIALALWFRYMLMTTRGSNFHGLRERITTRTMRDPILRAFLFDGRLFALLCVVLFIFGPVFVAALVLPNGKRSA